MVALRKPEPPGWMTVDEFLAWEPDDREVRRWALIDGLPVAMAPSSETHGAIQAELARLIGNHLADGGTRCRVITEPGVVPRVRADWNVRVPDLAVTCAPPSHAATVADPVLIVEILSPSNEAATRANIWAYVSIPSVREILTLRSTRIEAELLRRDADGNWPADPLLLRGEDMLVLESIDLTLPLAAAYRPTAVGT
ncbi:MAG: Uma2 family endonuclease [Rhodospirillales bacterium]|nr:Uma2 family endonuclease [Rhodospirillales bacterium]